MEYADVTAIDKLENFTDRLCAVFRGTHCIAWSLPLIIIWRLFASSSADPDLFARVAMGHLTLSRSSVPLVDPFAFTETLPRWIDHEWLSGVAFYVTAVTCGDTGLIFLKLLLATLATVCVVNASALYHVVMPSRLVWVSVCLLHAASAWTSTVRCQAFTYLFTPALYWAIIEYRRSQNALPLSLTPLLAVAWVNMHGGYALGCVIIGLFVANEIYQRRFSWTVISVALGWALAPTLTPYGFVVFVTFLFHALGMERPGIEEWLPLHRDIESLTATAILCTPLAAGILLYRGRHDLFGLSLLAFSAYCAFRHIRFLPFFMVTAAIFGAPYIHGAHEKLTERWRGLSWRLSRSGALALSICMALGSAQLIGFALNPASYRLRYDGYPVNAVEWLRRGGYHGRLLVDFNNGSFALWRLYPNFKVSVDGRYEETYPERTVRDNALALSPDQPGWEEALNRLNPTHILLSGRPNIEELAKRFGAQWHLLYKDQTSAILARESFTEGAPVEPERSPAAPPSEMWVARF